MFMPTNMIVAQKSPTEMTFISASFLFKINGAIMIDNTKMKNVFDVKKILYLTGYNF